MQGAFVLYLSNKRLLCSQIIDREKLLEQALDFIDKHSEVKHTCSSNQESGAGCNGTAPPEKAVAEDKSARASPPAFPVGASEIFRKQLRRLQEAKGVGMNVDRALRQLQVGDDE